MPTPFPSSWDVYIIVSKKQEQEQPKQNSLRDGVDSRDDQDRPESIIAMIAALLAAAQAAALETETQGTGEACFFFVIATTSSSSSSYHHHHHIIIIIMTR